MYYNEKDLTLIRPHSDDNKQKILPLMALILSVWQSNVWPSV